VDPWYVAFDIVSLALICSRYRWAFDTGDHDIETELDVAAVWASPDGLAEGQSAAVAGVATPAISAMAEMAATPGRTSERMKPPGKM
jgi:hypothetical protein